MSDTIFIHGLLVHAHHGVMAHEEKVGQRFIIDLELAIDLAPAGSSDKLADTAQARAVLNARSPERTPIRTGVLFLRCVRYVMSS